MSEKPTEIEFKFKISEDKIQRAIDNVNRNEKFIIVPTFEVYNDEYFQKDKKSGFLRKRTVFTFDNKDEKSSDKSKRYPRVDMTPEQNYIQFLKCGMCMFNQNPKTFIFDTKIKETYYTLKKKNIVKGVENNEETEIRSNENGNKFMSKIIEDNYKPFFNKTKRKAFIVEPICDGINLFPGCRVEIVSVSESNTDIVNDFYAEVEFADSRVLFRDERYENLTHDAIMNSLNMLPYLIFGIPYEDIEFESRSWDEIIRQQKTYKVFDDNAVNINFGVSNG